MLIDARLLGRSLSEFGHITVLAILLPTKSIDRDSLVSLAKKYVDEAGHVLNVIRNTTTGTLVEITLLNDESDIQAVTRIVTALTDLHNS